MKPNKSIKLQKIIVRNLAVIKQKIKLITIMKLITMKLKTMKLKTIKTMKLKPNKIMKLKPNKTMRLRTIKIIIKLRRSLRKKLKNQ